MPKSRSEKSLKNDRDNFYRNAKKQISELNQIRIVYSNATNPYQYVGKLLKVVDDCTDIAKRYLKSRQDDGMITIMDQHLASPITPDAEAERLNLDWLNRLDSSAVSIVTSLTDHFQPTSVENLLTVVKNCEKEIHSRFNERDTEDLFRNLGGYLNHAQEVVLGVVLFCHDGQTYYTNRQSFSIVSIVKGATIFTNGANQLFL